MFTRHIGELVVAMGDKREKLVEVALQALSAVCKVDPDAGPDDRLVDSSGTSNELTSYLASRMKRPLKSFPRVP
jgi:hypothetical protein